MQDVTIVEKLTFMILQMVVKFQHWRNALHENVIDLFDVHIQSCWQINGDWILLLVKILCESTYARKLNARIVLCLVLRRVLYKIRLVNGQYRNYRQYQRVSPSLTSSNEFCGYKRPVYWHTCLLSVAAAGDKHFTFNQHLLISTSFVLHSAAIRCEMNHAQWLWIDILFYFFYRQPRICVKGVLMKVHYSWTRSSCSSL